MVVFLQSNDFAMALLWLWYDFDRAFIRVIHNFDPY